MLSQETINKVRESNIYDVVQTHVELKREGSNFKGRCPFPNHVEKTPSFIVNPAKNIYKCFGCGAGGDAISFIMRKENKTFVDAVEQIARELNIPIEYTKHTEEEVEKLDHIKMLKVLNNKIAEFFHEELLHNEAALAYISKRFNIETIKEWKIGYAPEKNVLANIAWLKEYRTEAVELGVIMLSQKDSNYFDFFRDRITFPIIDDKNDVLGFSARIWKDSQQGEAKYINSKNSNVFNKSKSLFGLHKAATPIRKLQMAVLVEGNTDVIAMHNAEADNTIATCGTALTAEHCHLLKRFCNCVAIVRDGDKAGANATQKDIELLTEYGFETKVVQLPDGNDPFDFITNKK